MKYVYRAHKARGNLRDEIPLAHRINPIKKVSSLAFRTLGLISIIILILFFVLLYNVFLSVPTSERTARVDGYELAKVQLLGHFAYEEANKDDLRVLYPGLKIHKDVLKDLLEMRKAAALDGVEMVFLSGYRSIKLQKEIFYENKSLRNQIARERAKVSAPPGYSEHSTGYAIDIGDKYMRQTDFETEFELTPTFLWLEKNAAKYHFIMSFPRGNSQGVSYEPWHWRYEGTVEALRKFDLSNKKATK